MKTTLRLLAACLLLSSAPPARAGDAPADIMDRGRLIVLDGGTPVGIEDFEYARQGDSLMVSGAQTRTARVDGVTSKWVKKFGLVVDGRDFGLRSYTSNLEFDDKVGVTGVIPGDTAMTVYSEKDGAGEARRLVQPPGRLFIVDPPLFTLFDVICRNVSAQSLERRPVEMVTLGETPGTVQAVATAAGPDTIQWSGKRMIARRYVLTDHDSTFFLWVSPAGQMLRLVHQGGSLEVLREEPSAPAKPAKAKPRTR